MSSHGENSQTNYLYINKSLQKIFCSFFEALSINESFQLNFHDSTQTNRKTIITTEVLSFLSVEKIIHHFHLISFTGLNRRTETNDNYCKLKKKSIRVKASRPLVLVELWIFSELSEWGQEQKTGYSLDR